MLDYRAVIDKAELTKHQFVIDSDLAVALQSNVETKPETSDQTMGRAQVFEQLWPAMYGQREKKQQPLERVDYYMLEETQELIRRLQRFCHQLNIKPSTCFKVARRGKQLQVIGRFAAKQALTQLLNADAWFVDSFTWLQPNYANLAHSFEVLEFSECYEQSPEQATERFAHFIRDDKGLCFALNHVNGIAQAQVETPLNLYCVEN